MIVGIGVDIVELERIATLMNRQPQVVDRFLTGQEKELLDGKSETRRVEFAAGRFAAKEAGAKALGTGIGRMLSFLDMEIVPSNQGKPEMRVNPHALREAGLDPTRIKVHVSISHSRTHAIAQVVIEEV